MELEFALKKHQELLHCKSKRIKLYLYFSVGVYVGAGSRNEDLSTSGTSYLLQKMAT
jgi:predicted Zn-dependent peptidase